MKRILLITGPAGDAHGWGDLSVTESVCQAIKDNGYHCEIAFVESMDAFYKELEDREYDMVWSALYHISEKSETIGLADGEEWLADIFDERGIPYIGPNADTMKTLIQKTATHHLLAAKNVSVPFHYQIARGEELPEIPFPAFVKPSNESRSMGINDNSVVHNREELTAQVAWIHETFDQPALVEEYLPGQEYTVLMLGNGEHQIFLPGRVEVDPELFGKYPILRADLRGVGVTKIKATNKTTDAAIALCKEAMDALDCLDHVRADMRMSESGELKIIEVNGIPGLKPIKSWSPQLYTLHHPSEEGEMEDYNRLMGHIVKSALARY
ncbi:MAG: ATP-grasp domain-containing protein, partial [Desulfobacterales bacterium]|nr:ATP-grasp domain-containing protein [Desulfobacterales bacterium]